WIDDHVTRKRRLVGDDALALARLGAVACLRSGATTIVDASFSGDAVPAASEAGPRAVGAPQAVRASPPGAPAGPRPPPDARDRRLAGRAADAGELVELAVSPHAPYTVAPHVFEELVRRAREQGRYVVTHLAESDDELDALRDGSGPLPAATRRTGDEVAP